MIVEGRVHVPESGSNRSDIFQSSFVGEAPTWRTSLEATKRQLLTRNISWLLQTSKQNAKPTTSNNQHLQKHSCQISKTPALEAPADMSSACPANSHAPNPTWKARGYHGKRSRLMWAHPSADIVPYISISLCNITTGKSDETTFYFDHIRCKKLRMAGDSMTLDWPACMRNGHPAWKPCCAVIVLAALGSRRLIEKMIHLQRMDSVGQGSWSLGHESWCS